MQVFDLYAAGHGVSRVGEIADFRFRLGRPVLVRNTETREEVQVAEFVADNTGDDVLGLYTEGSAEALDPDKFEVVQ